MPLYSGVIIFTLVSALRKNDGRKKTIRIHRKRRGGPTTTDEKCNFDGCVLWETEGGGLAAKNVVLSTLM